MNILGIGGWEFVAILLIMLVVAGPKRMIHWAYIMGRYMGKLRIMWAETMTVLQKEFDEAGVDITLPKEPPTRRSINDMADKAFKPFTKPIQEAISEVEAEAKQVKESISFSTTNGHNTQPEDAKEDGSNANDSFGTWSGMGKKDS